MRVINGSQRLTNSLGPPSVASLESRDIDGFESYCIVGFHRLQSKGPLTPVCTTFFHQKWNKKIL